jgi:hypothetical protein
MNSWQAVSIHSSKNNVRFSICDHSGTFSNLDFLNILKKSDSFCDWYTRFLLNIGFDAFFWENRPIITSSLSLPYECSVVRSNYLSGKSPDRHSFSNYFDKDREVVSFNNLGNDARLVVPVPKSKNDKFTHIGCFLREAERHQIRTFWNTVADETLKRINGNPVWLSTSGLGVFWLHARIDSYPKYYQTEEYKTP